MVWTARETLLCTWSEIRSAASREAPTQVRVYQHSMDFSLSTTGSDCAGGGGYTAGGGVGCAGGANTPVAAERIASGSARPKIRGMQLSGSNTGRCVPLPDSCIAASVLFDLVDADEQCW